jgi:hypothetical protein
MSKEDDDLVASISKKMTIPQIKKELIDADIWIKLKKNPKTKAEFVSVYISNGLHKSADKEKKEVEAKTIVPTTPPASPTARKAPTSPPTGPPSPDSPPPSPSGSIKKPKEELILSLMINAHGIEGPQWPPTSPIDQYYKNNVRAYSRACVPGVVTISNPGDDRKSIDQVSTIFNNKPGSSTQEIMAEYTGRDRTYYKNFLDKFPRCGYATDALENSERCGGLTTYLSQKIFTFEDKDLITLNSRRRYYKTEFEWNQFLESRGVNVSDIRLKITASDGSVTYRTIFNPYDEIAQIYQSNKERKEPIDIITKFNLIFRQGIEFILKDVLHKEELIGPALKIFEFKEGENRISSLNLVKLYNFFKLVGITYVNIIDHSCRAIHERYKLTKEMTEELYKKEQQYSVKPEAFGKRRKSKRIRKHSKRKFSRKVI